MDSHYAMNSDDMVIIRRLNTFNDPKTFWTSVDREMKNAQTKAQKERWEYLAGIRYNELVVKSGYYKKLPTSKRTADGSRIKEIYTSNLDDRVNVIAEARDGVRMKDRPYVVGRGYDFKKGYWNGGSYHLTEQQAHDHEDIRYRRLDQRNFSRKPRVRVNRDGTASIRSLQEIQSKRSPSAIKADARVRAKNTVHTRDYKGNYRPVSLKDGKNWAKNPGSMDIVGVDAPYSKTQQRRNPKGQFVSAKKKPIKKRR